MERLKKWLAEHPAQAAGLRHAGTLLLAVLLSAGLARDVALDVCAQLERSAFASRSWQSLPTPSPVQSPE